MNGHLALAQHLIDLKVDIEKPDSQGMTPLLLAARGGHSDVMKTLQQKGALVEARNPEIGSALIIDFDKHTKFQV